MCSYGHRIQTDPARYREITLSTRDDSLKHWGLGKPGSQNTHEPDMAGDREGGRVSNRTRTFNLCSDKYHKIPARGTRKHPKDEETRMSLGILLRLRFPDDFGIRILFESIFGVCGVGGVVTTARSERRQYGTDKNQNDIGTSLKNLTP